MDSPGEHFAGTSNIQDCCNFSHNLLCQPPDPDRQREKERERDRDGERESLVTKINKIAKGMHKLGIPRNALVTLWLCDHWEMALEGFTMALYSLAVTFFLKLVTLI